MPTEADGRQALRRVLHLHRLEGVSPHQVTEELHRLQSEGVISRAPSDCAVYPSPLTVVGKAAGGVRVCVNMRAMNQRMLRTHFKMEGLLNVRDLIAPGAWMTSLDIRDAYMHVPIALQDRKFIATVWEDTPWIWNALPFGLADAPRAFTKLLRAPISALRRQGITLIAYIDDILIIGESESSTRRDTDAAYECLMSLGFRINQEKSERDPSTIRTFLGTVKMTFSLHPEKWRKLRNTLVQMHRLDMATPRQMAALIGKLNWTLHMSLPARLKIRPLLRWKHRALTTTSGHWDTPVELETLDWWIQFFPQWNGKSFRPRVSEATIFTDASDYGWGPYYPSRVNRRRKLGVTGQTTGKGSTSTSRS